MAHEVEKRDTDYVPGPVRRMGSAVGLATIFLLDLLALDDITTAGAWMPEIAFLIASVPALIVLAWFTFKPRVDVAHRRDAAPSAEPPQE